MELQDFMRLEVFEARLDEFSLYDYNAYCRACRKVLLKHGAKTWGDIPETKLGRVFQDIRKALMAATYRASSRKIS